MGKITPNGYVNPMRKLPPFLLLISLPLLLTCTSEPEISPSSAGGIIPDGYPVILLHGLNGFGRENYSSFWYWGGQTDLETELRTSCCQVRTAAVGPLSSNWDRSCEFYAYLVGGTVDYGKAHSEKYGHDRFGETYEGILPGWGSRDPITERVQKIHIIAHSMGGQTARMVAQLLEEGSEVERKATGDETSPLFTGGHHWIKSITTISTPHDGSTLSYEMTSYRQREHMALLALGFLVWWDESFPLHNDLKLDHWEWTRQKDGESRSAYEERIRQTVLDWNWANLDFSDFDVSPEGAREMNGWVKARDDIYYFSWATRITYRNKAGQMKNYPLISLPLIPFADIISRYTAYRSSLIQIDESWRYNDGVVNTISMDGPTLGSSDIIKPWGGRGIPPKGVWNYRGELYPMDHLQVIGMTTALTPPSSYPGLTEWYREQIELVTSLP